MNYQEDSFTLIIERKITMTRHINIRALWSTMFLFMCMTGGIFHGAQARNILGGKDIISDSLKYIGHSFVKIKTLEGKVIYIDPFGVNEFSDSADIVLVTHEHSDHNEVNRVNQKWTCTVIRNANAIISGVYQSFTIGNIKITAVAAYNQYHQKNQCVGYIVEFDSIKLYHAGDTGKITEMADLAGQDIDYALIPMDAIYTMTPEVATEAAALIHAKHDMPIHTMPPPDTYSDAIVARFTSPNKLVVHPGITIALEQIPTFVENKIEHPFVFVLDQNYPNPFNPSTTISYSISQSTFVSLTITDILGKEIESLVNKYQKAGRYQLQYTAYHLASGIYFVKLQTGSYFDAKKCILLK
jgi:Predicted Zn-dependent hydrolases of the beta-lactamase fold